MVLSSFSTILNKLTFFILIDSRVGAVVDLIAQKPSVEASITTRTLEVVGGTVVNVDCVEERETEHGGHKERPEEKDEHKGELHDCLESSQVFVFACVRVESPRQSEQDTAYFAQVF